MPVNTVMDFTFYMPTRVISGAGCVRRHAELLRSFGRRCLIMTGGHAAKASGALDDMLDTLTAAGVEATVFSGVGANPLLSQCQSAARAAIDSRAEFVVGIGGGSVMDAAKASAWLAANDPDDTEALMQGKLPVPPLPLILAGTTAGTGSEVGPAAVLTMDDGHYKRSLSHPLCFARVSFADPRYTDTVPRATTISTALDALAHAVEGWFAPECGDVITAFGEKAVPMVLEGLTWLAGHDGLPGAALRDRLYYGSLWAGMVLSATGTAFPHPLGYVLTERYDIPHGMACAVFMSAFLDRAEQYAPERAAQLYALCGGRQRIQTVLDALVRCDVTMTAEQVEALRPRWQSVKNFDRTPGRYTADDALRLYRERFVR